MNILVAIKQVPDPNAIRFDASGNYPANTQRVVNEYDSYAVEEAIRIKEQTGQGEVTAVVVGPAGAKDAVTRALAMGADQGVLIVTNDALDSFQVASVLAEEVRAGSYDLVLVGQETSDGGTGNVGPQLAALLGLPLVSNVVGLELGDGKLTLQREVEDGRHIVEVTPPAVLCALTGLNEPRYPSLKGIMAARKKPITDKQLSNYSVPASSTSWGQLRQEQRAVQGTIIDGTDAETAAQQLITMLKERKLV